MLNRSSWTLSFPISSEAPNMLMFQNNTNIKPRKSSSFCYLFSLSDLYSINHSILVKIIIRKKNSLRQPKFAYYFQRDTIGVTFLQLSGRKRRVWKRSSAGWINKSPNKHPKKSFQRFRRKHFSGFSENGSSAPSKKATLQDWSFQNVQRHECEAHTSVFDQHAIKA